VETFITEFDRWQRAPARLKGKVIENQVEQHLADQWLFLEDAPKLESIMPNGKFLKDCTKEDYQAAKVRQ
jgi:hypothetical protein